MIDALWTWSGGPAISVVVVIFCGHAAGTIFSHIDAFELHVVIHQRVKVGWWEASLISEYT